MVCLGRMEGFGAPAVIWVHVVVVVEGILLNHLWVLVLIMVLAAATRYSVYQVRHYRGESLQKRLGRIQSRCISCKNQIPFNLL